MLIGSSLSAIFGLREVLQECSTSSQWGKPVYLSKRIASPEKQIPAANLVGKYAGTFNFFHFI